MKPRDIGDECYGSVGDARRSSEKQRNGGRIWVCRVQSLYSGDERGER